MRDIDDRRAQAAAYWDAKWARWTDIDPNTVIPIWTAADDPNAAKKPTVWVPVTDRDAFIEAVASMPGGTTYDAVRPRTRVCEDAYRHGGAGTAATPHEIFVDFDSAVGKSVDEDGHRYAADEAEMRSLVAAFSDEKLEGCQPHLIVSSGRGWHLYWHTEAIDREMLARFERGLLDWLAAQNIRVDRGVIADVGRLSRAAGSMYSRQGSPLIPVRVLHADTSSAPLSASLLDRALPLDISAAGRSEALPAAEISLWQRIGEQVSIIEYAERRFGWEVSESGDRMIPSRHLDSGEADVLIVTQNKTSEAATLRPFSEKSAEELGVETDRNATGAHVLYGQLGSWAAVAEVGHRLEEQPELVGDLMDELAAGNDIRGWAKATDLWPDELSEQHRNYLAYRGVSGKVAAERGYRTAELADYPDLARYRAAVPIAGLDESVLTIPIQGPDGKEAETVRSVLGGIKHGKGFFHFDMPQSCRQYADDVATPLIIASADGHRPFPEEANLEPDAVAHARSFRPKNASPGFAQTTVDAILSTARVEGVQVAAIGTPTWSSLVQMPGTKTNPSRHPRLNLQHVALRGREVLLAPRTNWRAHRSFAALIRVLLDKGARVKVIDVLPDEGVGKDPSRWGVGDSIATGHRIRTLMATAIPGDLALAQSTADLDNGDVALAAWVREQMLIDGGYRYNADSRTWMMDVGNALAPCAAPVWWVQNRLARADLRSTVRDASAVLTSLSTDPALVLHESDIDGNLREIVAGRPGAAMVISLKTGEATPRPRGYPNVRFTPVDYDPKAEAPRWGQFLREFQCGDDLTASWYQRLWGVAILGEKHSEAGVVQVGGGSNGKTVHDATLRYVLGTYAQALDTDQLTSKSTNQFSNGWLSGARILLASETESGGRLNSERWKALHQHDLPLLAERKYGSAFEISPTWMVLLSTNHAPKVTETSHGIWRRLRVVPCDLRLKPDQIDPLLTTKLRSEAPGILAWAVRGAVEVLRSIDAGEKGDPLGSTPRIDRASSLEREKADVVSQFIEQHCIVAAGEICAQGAFHSQLREWQEEEEGRAPWSATAIRNRMDELGFVKRNANGKPRRDRVLGAVYSGLRFATPEELAEQSVEAAVETLNSDIDRMGEETPAPAPYRSEKAAAEPQPIQSLVAAAFSMTDNDDDEEEL